ncbi:hypothetical protein DRO58_02895 [Candidatus Bathyarchaeota archaeon]|nr:MAG: hypothetical protein DRO58_02895 [Candidatus Bathyarchaeota archaeon]
MPERSVFDTRFFIEYFYSKDPRRLGKLKGYLRSVKVRFVSAVTVHELYRIDLEKEGKDVARLRSEVLRRDFKLIGVDYELAVRSAELRSRYRIPMADSMIAATAQVYKCPVVSDDPHFKKIKGLETRWIG